MLSIPELDELKFSKSDALPLGKKENIRCFIFFFYSASFYTIALPKKTYEFIPRAANPPPDPFHLLLNGKYEPRTIDISMINQPMVKRKIREDEENESESAAARVKK